MPARDLYHEIVRNALIADGWSLTHDPYKLKNELFKNVLLVDIGAEKWLIAEKEHQKIGIDKLGKKCG